MRFTDQKIITCYHCGEDCEEEILYFDEKEFCCAGCKLVYEVLQANDMCSYYALADNPVDKKVFFQFEKEGKKPIIN